jgi:hypothetical protein
LSSRASPHTELCSTPRNSVRRTGSQGRQVCAPVSQQIESTFCQDAYGVTATLMCPPLQVTLPERTRSGARLPLSVSDSDLSGSSCLKSMGTCRPRSREPRGCAALNKKHILPSELRYMTSPTLKRSSSGWGSGNLTCLSEENAVVRRSCAP